MTANIIQIISIILTTVISIISVVIAVKSLKTTQKSIEEANRPYVVVYKDYVHVLSNITEYLVIKNFGKTGATIESLIFNPEYYDKKNNPLFKNLENTFIAPGQSIKTVISSNAFGQKREGITTLTIRYKDTNRSYYEEINLNEELIRDLSFMKTDPSGYTIESVITRTAQEFLRRNL
ncbi:hypothetical protein EC917_101295 [Bacillus thuringiensis]|uniref:Uncharacterized protein n=1 Tax=Bacillus thuringiensis TaxID=1428 RepID=A0A4R4BM31_BACTU|nr:hypothetical protein [Bacillus thuringiensis]TCW59041.1 hypothetical protein EC917_101295 [Bacillus thuringiensis]TCW59719.1 hypothetical protein EC910_101349 [Bacillus thuringiensis]